MLEVDDEAQVERLGDPLQQGDGVAVVVGVLDAADRRGLCPDHPRQLLLRQPGVLPDLADLHPQGHFPSSLVELLETVRASAVEPPVENFAR